MASDTRSSDSPAFARLKTRAQFLHVGRGRRWHGKALTLQAAPRQAVADDAPRDGRPLDAGIDTGPARFGFTLTKKVGCAVVRNRVRRRLREVVRLGTDLPARAGHDYVLVGREAGLRMPFADLRQELERSLAKAHAPGDQGGRKDGRGGKERPRGQRPAGDGPGAQTTSGEEAGTTSGERRAAGRTAPERIRPRP